MYHFKPVKGNREEDVFPVAHYSAKIVLEDSPEAQEGTAEPGITIKCAQRAALDEGLGAARILRLPKDADVVYIMNDAGDTIQSYRWPLRQPQQQAQEVA